KGEAPFPHVCRFSRPTRSLSLQPESGCPTVPRPTSVGLRHEATTVQGTKEKRMAKEKKIPTTPGAAADLLYSTRQKRLEIEKKLAGHKEKKKTRREYLHENLPKQGHEDNAG